MKNKEFFNDYMKAFLKQNSKLNLISKNDEKLLWEKHVFDSLAIEKFFDKYKFSLDEKEITLLDFGTGGGFPAVPISLTYPNIKVTAMDSIRKKINAISAIKEELNIRNLTPLCGRVETLEKKFDIITSRAVANLGKIVEYAIPRLKNDGYFIAYKSVKASEEIETAQPSLKKYKAKVLDVIQYDLPLEENHTRNLVVITNQ